MTTINTTHLRGKIAPGQLPAHCNNCDNNVDPVVSESGPHIKATCPQCNSFLKFLKRIDAGPGLKETMLKMAQRLSFVERQDVARKILTLENTSLQ